MSSVPTDLQLANLCRCVYFSALQFAQAQNSSRAKGRLGFQAIGKLSGPEMKLFQAMACDLLDHIPYPEYGPEIQDHHHTFGMSTVRWVLSPQQMFQVLCDLAVGLLVPSAPLPPDTLIHHAVLVEVWRHLGLQLDCEIDMDEKTVKEDPDPEEVALRTKRYKQSQEAKASADPSAHDALMQQWKRENESFRKKKGLQNQEKTTEGSEEDEPQKQERSATPAGEISPRTKHARPRQHGPIRATGAANFGQGGLGPAAAFQSSRAASPAYPRSLLPGSAQS